MVRRKAKPSFEEAIAELESLVETMEQGDQPLEDALKMYERGVLLTRICQEALQDAEQKIKMLSGEGDQARLEAFATDD